jgi:acetolactate synthase-1/2/3 large subunit
LKKIRVVDYIMDFLCSKGSDSIFVLTGNGSMYINDAIAKTKRLKYYTVRHETAAPMMAESYSRLTGKLGVVCVTAGPGATNTVSGLAEAWVDSGAVMVLSGQSPRKQIPKNNIRTFGTAGFNVLPVVKPMTKYAVCINNPKSIRYHLEKSYHIATTGRPGPVWIDIPMDVQYALIDPKKLKSFSLPSTKNIQILTQKINTIIDILMDSKRPLIIAGHGVRQSKSIDILKKLINKLQIPTGFSRLGNDILPFSNKLNMGQLGRRGQKYSNKLLKSADVVLVLGCRLATPLGGENLNHFDKKAKIIMIDIDKNEIEFLKKHLYMYINGDVNICLKNLSKSKKLKKQPEWDSWLSECSSLKNSNPMIEKDLFKNDKQIDLYNFMSELDKCSNQNDIFTTDAGSNYYVGGQVYCFENNQREITSGAYAAMGLSIPLAIGAAVAMPDKRILAVTGDGSLELNIQELKTISYYNFNIKLFVINNGGYASMRNWQDKFFDGRRIGSDNDTGAEMLDLSAVAKAFDLRYECISDVKSMNKDIKRISKKPGPIFIEVVCSSEQEIVQAYTLTEWSN